MICTLIAGVNGVGKSSLTGVLLLERCDLGIVINPDKIAAERNGNFLEGAKIALRMIEDSIAGGIDFTQETTLSGHQPLSTVKKAKEYGYYIRLYYVGLDTLNESISRIENRVRKGGHNIASEIVAKRFEKRFEDVSKILPHCHEAHFLDNENGFADVAEYKNGKLNIISDTPPKWILDLKKHLDDKAYASYLSQYNGKK